MSNTITETNVEVQNAPNQPRGGRIPVPEIAKKLAIGRVGVYAMLEQGILPGIRFGRRWIVTRHAYEEWERTCGLPKRSGLQRPPEVVVN